MAIPKIYSSALLGTSQSSYSNRSTSGSLDSQSSPVFGLRAGMEVTKKVTAGVYGSYSNANGRLTIPNDFSGLREYQVEEMRLMLELTTFLKDNRANSPWLSFLIGESRKEFQVSDEIQKIKLNNFSYGLMAGYNFSLYQNFLLSPQLSWVRTQDLFFPSEELGLNVQATFWINQKVAPARM